jgi:PKD repeat protein
VSYAWNFGDGGQGSGSVVSHPFGNQQTYSVTLTVTNDRGFAASITQPVPVGSGSLPTPLFTFSPTTPLPGQMVFFNGSASTPGAGHRIVSYAWTFGDGNTASGVNASHAFAAVGTYNVQLTVSDETGQSSTSTGTAVTVATTPPPPLTAVFVFSPTTPHAGGTVFFNAAGSAGAIATYTWDFGDGSPIVTFNAPTTTTSHPYPVVGTYNVTLTVRDSGTGRATSTQALTILP